MEETQMRELENMKSELKMVTAKLETQECKLLQIKGEVETKVAHTRYVSNFTFNPYIQYSCLPVVVLFKAYKVR